ncbi:hypothetical protein N7414_26845 [Pseudomonas sp. GD04087]|uniref:hypothetical protein n=1 Tax=unclassified Pseudomonas TaxID=196821 RepID=UPI002449BC0B|nr:MULTISPECIES: hypothetical protein [unclassified Pseudomonas]MDH0292753.1 hypothetical protein [Pseudomonas sp. GD04087]MDH1050090.1 hypothetical protein [Pseudomonas sp. GD03903]MDH2002854.1 hypothetical protein [Pseudomonas sp. GD03691]
MTVVNGKDLRAVQPGEAFAEAQVLYGEGFSLQPRDVKVFKPTGAPVIFYDVFKDGEQDRSGIASLVLEPDASRVRDVGHACANLAESCQDPDLLARVGELLIAHGYEQGLPSVRIVVPAADARSVAACEAQSNACQRQQDTYGGQAFACFDYPADGD